MTDLPTIARDNAISVEGKLTGHAKRADGGLNLRFQIHPHGIPKALSDAPIGARYVMALVQVDDNEQPVAGVGTSPTGLSMTVEQGETRHNPGAENVIGTNNAQLVSKGVALDEPAPRQPRKPVAPEKRLAQRAGILCTKPKFWEFMTSNPKNPFIVIDEESAALVVCRKCNVDSRRDIIPGTPAGDLFEELEGQFQLWERYPEFAS